MYILPPDNFEGFVQRSSNKIRKGFSFVHKDGLKLNCSKFTFGIDECEYLGYVLTRQGIKPESKKIKAILAINPPINVKELRSFLGIVQYYRDLRGKQSEMLSQLTDLISKCG